MAGTFIEVHASGLHAITQALNELASKGRKLEEPLAEIGEHLLLSHRDRFDDEEDPFGLPWTAISEKTKQRKLAQGKPANILRQSNTLRDTLNYQLQNDQLMLGSPLDYAATHQFGRDEANIPARPFLGLSGEDQIEILYILQDYLLEAL